MFVDLKKDGKEEKAVVVEKELDCESKDECNDNEEMGKHSRLNIMYNATISLNVHRKLSRP